MTDEIAFKQLMIDAIVGVGFPSVVLAVECERVGLAEFSGDHFNPSWSWHRSKLERVTVEQLQELYQGLAEAREENERNAIEAGKDNMPSIIMGAH